MLDLNLYSDRQIDSFIFSHAEEDNDWYWRDEWDFFLDDIRGLEYTESLFNSAASRFHKRPQHERKTALDFLTSYKSQAFFSTSVVSAKISISKRCGTIKSIPQLFKQSLDIEPILPITIGLFERIITAFGQMPAESELSSALKSTVHEVLFSSSNSYCLLSALHGVNHLYNSDPNWGMRILSDFLEKSQGIHDEWISSYAKESINSRMF